MSREDAVILFLWFPRQLFLVTFSAPPGPFGAPLRRSPSQWTNGPMGRRDTKNIATHSGCTAKINNDSNLMNVLLHHGRSFITGET